MLFAFLPFGSLNFEKKSDWFPPEIAGWPELAAYYWYSCTFELVCFAW